MRQPSAVSRCAIAIIMTCVTLGCSRPAHAVSCPADWDRSGAVTVTDIFAFLAEYFRGGGDFNRDRIHSVQDIFDFLGGYFARCSGCQSEELPQEFVAPFSEASLSLASFLGVRTYDSDILRMSSDQFGSSTFSIINTCAGTRSIPTGLQAISLGFSSVEYQKTILDKSLPGNPEVHVAFGYFGIQLWIGTNAVIVSGQAARAIGTDVSGLPYEVVMMLPLSIVSTQALVDEGANLPVSRERFSPGKYSLLSRSSGVPPQGPDCGPSTGLDCTIASDPLYREPCTGDITPYCKCSCNFFHDDWAAHCAFDSAVDDAQFNLEINIEETAVATAIGCVGGPVTGLATCGAGTLFTIIKYKRAFWKAEGVLRMSLDDALIRYEFCIGVR